jgi:hypothetical protein
LRSKIQTEVWSLLQEADDVEVAYPHQHIFFDDTSGTAKVELSDRATTNGRSGADPADPDGDGRPGRPSQADGGSTATDPTGGRTPPPDGGVEGDPDGSG